MDFILPNPALAPNATQEPIIEPSGVLNLRDWNVAESLRAGPRYPIKLESGKMLDVTEGPETASPALLELTDDELRFVSTLGNFPAVNALCFLRGISNLVDSVAPMLSIGSFFTEHSEEIKKIVERNIKSKSSSREWIEYYASSLFDYPIFNTIFNLLTEKNRAAIGLEYFEQFTDIKYLSATQLEKLTLEQKTKVLITVLTKFPGNDGKLDMAIALFTAADTIEHDAAVLILNATRGSTDAGRLMVCLGLVNDYTNAYNTVSTWISHCIKEHIGTNQSVWYKTALDLEVQHQFSLAGEYIKNLRGTPIGLNQTTSELGGISGAFKSNYSNNKPIGL